MKKIQIEEIDTFIKFYVSEFVWKMIQKYQKDEVETSNCVLQFTGSSGTENEAWNSHNYITGIVLRGKESYREIQNEI